MRTPSLTLLHRIWLLEMILIRKIWSLPPPLFVRLATARKWCENAQMISQLGGCPFSRSNCLCLQYHPGYKLSPLPPWWKVSFVTQTQTCGRDVTLVTYQRLELFRRRLPATIVSLYKYYLVPILSQTTK